jgi:antitoxin Phd
MQWQIKDAKSRFSELVEKAISGGPQHIAKRGKVQAVILSIEEFERLRALQPSFRDYLLSGPKVDEFEVPRDPDTVREIDL